MGAAHPGRAGGVVTGALYLGKRDQVSAEVYRQADGALARLELGDVSVAMTVEQAAALRDALTAALEART